MSEFPPRVSKDYAIIHGYYRPTNGGTGNWLAKRYARGEIEAVAVEGQQQTEWWYRAKPRAAIRAQGDKT